MLRCLNDLAGLVMVGEEREPLVTRSVRLAKAKVAGSNPVFRSKLPGFRGLAGPGFFLRVAFNGDAARSTPLAS